MSKVVIIGAGAAGMLAAGTALENGAQVLLIEKNDKPARKVMITGKGRCNLTNNCSDIDTLIKNVATNGRFLYSAFSSFMPKDTMALFEKLGVPLKTERGNRVFPVSDKAADIADALKRYAKNAEIIKGKAKRFNLNGDKIESVTLEDGRIFCADSFILATGGKSYPLTGSTGDGYVLARSLGHTVTKIRPSLVALKSPNGFCPKLQGLSLKNVNLSLFEDGKKKALYSEFGEMLFTHFGVSGPLVLSASAHIKNFADKNYYILLDLKPALSDEQLEKRISRDFCENSNKNFANSLDMLLPKKLIPIIVSLSGIEPDKKVNQIARSERLALVNLLKNFKIEISDFWSIEQAIITSGGISVKEIEPKTMRSKIIKNLYFAGEIIDVDAYTGGFNLQIAFATGRAAGKAVTEENYG